MKTQLLADAFAELSTPLIADAALRLKIPLRISPPGIRPVIDNQRLAGPALPARLTRYLENVAEGRNSDGTWSVTRLAIYPATSTQGAMCR